MANQQKDDSMSRSDTTAPGGAQPVPQHSEAGKTGSEVAGKVGGTSTGQGADLTGGDASSGDIPPPTGKGGASAA